MELSLIVLKSSNPFDLAQFYGRVGMAVVEEQHGNGPIHYSISLNSGVIELYPAKQPVKTTFGLAVSDVNDFKSKWMIAGGTIGKMENLLLDPDGNLLHIQ
jgi:hypothetical protein